MCAVCPRCHTSVLTLSHVHRKRQFVTRHTDTAVKPDSPSLSQLLTATLSETDGRKIHVTHNATARRLSVVGDSTDAQADLH